MRFWEGGATEVGMGIEFVARKWRDISTLNIGKSFSFFTRIIKEVRFQNMWDSKIIFFFYYYTWNSSPKHVIRWNIIWNIWCSFQNWEKPTCALVLYMILWLYIWYPINNYIQLIIPRWEKLGMEASMICISAILLIKMCHKTFCWHPKHMDFLYLYFW